MLELFTDITFTKKDFTAKGLPKGEYDSCTFVDCNFSEMHLSNYTFLECSFTGCNFTNVKFGGTTLNNIVFNDCKMLGADISVCNTFLLQLRFEVCVLDMANCYQLPLSKTIFKECSLQETDFTEANLTESRFVKCNLKSATFEQTNLQKSDFTTAYNFEIDPTKNKLQKARFSKEGAQGLLSGFGVTLE